MNEITAVKIRQQAWKWYAVAISWPVYLFLLPFTYKTLGWWCIAFMIFPGVYIFTWAGYLMHESWHKYVPGIAHGFFYDYFSYVLLTDPQNYRLVHGFHHSKVNTWDDTEFHPLNNIKNRFVKIACNCAEIVFGSFFLVFTTTIMLPRHPVFKHKYRIWKLPISMLIWIFYIGSITVASPVASGVPAGKCLLLYVMTLWLGSLVVHHSQLIEHGNVIAEGSWEKRNGLTRNLRDTGFLEKLFLFFTHGDSREHVLHHTVTSVYSRPFPRHIPMPDNAVYITIPHYLKILWNMIQGKEES